MSTRARYDEVVGFYEAENPDDYSAPVDQAFLAMVGQVAGLRVLDVACGAGRISRELARRGAEVVGVDISAGLVARARSAEEAEPLGVLYRIGDIASPDSFAGERFDLATCHFGLSDIDDLDGAVAATADALRPGGALVFSILHPCFPGWGPEVAASWPPGGYFEERWWRTTAARSTLRQQVGANHRTLATCVNTLGRYGLGIERLAEPPPPGAWTEDEPERDLVPVFLVGRCRAGPLGAAP